MSLGDTIVAVATPHGESAIAMVRVSGPLCESLMQSIFEVKLPIKPRHAYFLKYKDLNKSFLDEVVCCWYSKGSSFTGEQMMEVTCHGNPLIVQSLVVDLVHRGCRLAQPGEFSRTAFLNNKIDLSQAEAIADMISAKSYEALAAAKMQLGGDLSEKISTAMDVLLQVIAYIEAYIDFPEEDLPKEDKQGPLLLIKQLQIDLKRLLDTNKYRGIIKDGLHVAIVGAPNAGKSSLLNVLLGQERALVSHLPGTTRDFIRERMLIGSSCIHFIDTAGLRQTNDSLEEKGIQKSKQVIKEADFYLWVIDVSSSLPTMDKEVRSYLVPEKTLIIENKIDLPRALDLSICLDGYLRVQTSLLNNMSESIHDQIIEAIRIKSILPPENTLVINARHALALEKAIGSLMIAYDNIVKEMPLELAASELGLVLDALGDILGKVDNEAMLDKLFSSFCIGK